MKSGGGYGSAEAGGELAVKSDHPGWLVLPEFDVNIVDENDDVIIKGKSGESVRAPEGAGRYV